MFKTPSQTSICGAGTQRPGRRRSGMVRIVPALLLLLLLAGCSGNSIYRKAQAAEAEGDWDQAVLSYLEAVRIHPDNIAYRAALMRAKIQAAQSHFRLGKQFREAGVLERAMVEYRRAVELDPSNQYAESELRKVVEELAAAKEGRTPRSIAEMKDGVEGVQAQPPVLNPRSKEPIDLIFSEPASVLDIYRALGQAFGVNVLFDPKLKDQEISIVLNEVTALSGLEILMRTVNHFYKVLDEHSIIIADDTPQNRRTYEDQVIQTFFLDNAEVKDVMTMVRSLIGAKHVAANEQLNAIVLRDTADKVKVAEQIIRSNDKAKAEVVVDVELLQINTSTLQELGLSLSENRTTISPNFGATGDDGTGGNSVRFSDLEFINENNWFITVPSFFFDFAKSNGDAQALAQPKLRITEGEKGNLTIGDRVPIPTTTFNTNNQGVGGTIVPVTSFQYQEVGIKIEIEPRVHHNEEVTLDVNVEVSNIADFVTGSGGQEQPVIGTRNIQTSIRLRDGETNFLAGLIRQEEGQTESGIPGLSDIPVLGRLFKRTSTDNRRTDIVLTLTPHVIRRASITERDLMPIWVGTEANITFRGGSPRVESNVSGPFDGSDDSRERVRERLRERLRSLPRGLQGEDAANQGEDAEESESAQPSGGIDLAPTGGLNDPFGRTEEDDDDDG
ncbi:MAG: secretin N-terminal domain-containing protein [Acidobacteriota bacterium]